MSDRRRRLFNIRSRHNLWDDSSDEDETPSGQNNSTQPNNVIIDLTHSPVRAVPTLPPPPVSSAAATSINQQQTRVLSPYIPRTLHENSRRHSILPAFPTSFYNDRPHLLLANVPMNKLSQEQLNRRQQEMYPLGYKMNENPFDTPSYFRSHYQSFISSLIYQYNVDESILDYNLYRFMECFHLFADDYICRHHYRTEQFELNDKQKKYAFEFYLQVDADVFFMKTCAFRNAQPRSMDEGLFCIDEPASRYSLSPCHNCPLCVPTYNTDRRQHQSVIHFGPNQKFQFKNGYQTILNCPADCQTRNIIYVMTCPCGEFEYIGETSQRLNDRLWYHRQHVNRIIHEFLIGERNVQLSQPQEKDHETLVKDRMLLYKHMARCPSAMQLFLNFNPVYWRFIPITQNEALERNQSYFLPTSLVLLDSNIPTSIASKDRQAIPATVDTRSDETVRSCIRNLPPVPPGYTYSIRQRAEQFLYFKDKLDITTKQDHALDLFNVAVIAVLPLDASESVRRFVESLFITHAETKLNTSGRLLHQQQQQDDDDDDEDDDDDDDTINLGTMSSEEIRIIDRGEWCRHLFQHYN